MTVELMQPPGRLRQASLKDLFARSNLTQRQLLMWIGQKMQPDSPDYNMASLFLLDGPLDTLAFSRAARALVQSCDNLRTVIVERDGVPYQQVESQVQFTVEVVDLRGMPDADERLQQRVRERTLKPFSMDGPLFSFTVLLIDDRRSAWYVNVHHIIGDGWSVRLMFDRLSALYSRTVNSGAAPSVIEVPRFADYVAARRASHDSGEHARDAEWWERCLGETEPILFYGRPAPARPGPARRVSLDLGAARTSRLARLASETGQLWGPHQALQNLLNTALYAWLHRVGPNAEPTVALTFHNRDHESNDVMGLVMQTLPVRIQVQSGDTFRTLLESLVESTFEALEHRHCTVANPLHKRAWEVVLNYLPTRFRQFAGMDVHHTWVHTEHTSQALAVTVHDFEAAGTLRIDFDLLIEAFQGPNESRLTGHFLAMLDAMLDDLDTPVHAVDILAAEERTHLLEPLVTAPTATTTYVGLVEEAVRRRPDHPVVRGEDCVWTMGELNAEANRLARYLETLGVGPRHLVGIHLRPGPLVPLAVLAVLKAGAGYLPLDAGYPVDRLAFMLDDADARIILTESALRGRLDLGDRKVVIVDGEGADWRALSSEDAPLRASLDDFAYIIYTSGSTGRPKGVRIQHRSLATFLLAIRDTWIGEDDILPFTSPLSFDMHVGDLLLPLMVGATIVPLPREVAADGTQLRRALEAMRATALFATPATFRMLIDAGWEGSEQLKVLCGGEAMSPELAHDLLARVASVQNVYGPSETTCYVTRHRVCDGESPVPIGSALPGVRLYVLDEHGKVLPEGMPGELVIGGPQVGYDYLNRPELTAERFLADPFDTTPGARMYRSGDLVRIRPDRVVEYLGRIDHQVKIRGYRIELGEIEALLAQHAEVRQALVMAREDTPGDKRLVGYVVTDAERVPDAAELKRFLRTRLPEFMVPSAFVTLNEFPVTPNGKIDRKQLPAPERQRAEQTDADAPRDLLQFQITKIFEDVLGVQPVGIHDSFFELGGNSLLGVRLLSQIERVIARQIPSLQTLFDAPTPNQLASLLSRDGWQPALGSVVALQPRGKGAPFFCVHAFIGDVCRDLGRNCGPDHPFYGLQPRGLDGREEPLTTIPEMASFYISEMRKVQPVGPYHIGGYSFGGLVAVEMAAQLRDQGEEVGLLAVIDVGPHNLRPRSLAGRLRARVNGPLIALEKVVKMLREEHPTQLVSAIRRKLRTRMLKRRVARAEGGSVSTGAGEAIALTERMYGMSRWPGNYQRIARINLLALLRYAPRPYDGPLTLIRRRGRLHAFTLEERDWSWGEVASSVDVHFVNGNHDEIMVEPGVRQVGQIIESCLRNAAPSPPSEQPEF